MEPIKPTSIMKTILKSIFAVSVMAAAVSCAKETLSEPAQDGVIVKFTATEIQTKSHFGAIENSKYPTLWTNGQQVAVIYSGGAITPSKVDITVSEDLKTASFSQEFTASASAASHNFYVLSPANAALGYSNGSYNVYIPSSQIPVEGSCDELAQITAASHVSETFDTEISLQFQHVTAYGRMSLTLPADAGEVSSVSLTATKDVAGRYFYSYADKSLTANSVSKTITLQTTKTADIFFGCAPVDLSGELLEITVTASNGTYEKTIDFSSAAKPLKFEAGVVSAFSVSGFEKKNTDEVYTLVTDASQLKIGDKVIIAAQSANYAISTTQNSNNRGQASITKKDGTIVNPGDDVQLFTLENGATTGTYALNTGSGYIYAASSSSNNLKTQDELDANASWNLTFTTTGVATITATGTNTRNTIKYNTKSSVFSCYSSGQQSVAIYTDGKGTGTIPTPPTIVVDKTEISLAYDDEETYSDINVTVSGQEGEVSCEAFDDEKRQTESTWLIASYENGKIVYSAVGKNETTSPRTAYIIISASNADGETSKTIVVTQGSSTSGMVFTVESSSLGSASTAYTKMDDFISYKNSASNTYSNPLRVYKDNIFTILATNANIMKIEYTCSSAAYAKELSNSTFSVGAGATSSVTLNNTMVTVVVTGTSTEVSVKAGAQFRLSSMKVTYSK